MKNLSVRDKIEKEYYSTTSILYKSKEECLKEAEEIVFAFKPDIKSAATAKQITEQVEMQAKII